ncbi:MAG: hypothetical protein IID28_03540 [Planctomycetes bacterium]|nr:hypothetical protein [Planctomycetota bacterium]
MFRYTGPSVVAPTRSAIPWLGPFQAFRGLLWAGLALLVIHMMRGRWWEKGLATGLLFAVLMNAQLLLPNLHMPASVRMVHLVETASSNFILGWWLAWLFRALSRAEPVH